MKIKEMVGAIYDLIAYHGDEEKDLTEKQRMEIKILYGQINPHEKIKQNLLNSMKTGS